MSAPSRADGHQRKDSGHTFGSSWAYPTDPKEYKILQELGRGVSATVYLGVCRPLRKKVAIKLLNLEVLGASLDTIIKEAQIMRQQEHPNVLPLLCAFLQQHMLWMVTPYLSGGSISSVMEFAHPKGFEDEAVIATVMREVLRGLAYMHAHDRIHRDIKAANILIGGDGRVVLADFGITAIMEKAESSFEAPPSQAQRVFNYLGRSTFVGTPLYMAPEVMAPEAQGYFAAADIWSLGITLIELATGEAPNASATIDKILMSTLNDDARAAHLQLVAHRSQVFRDVVARCLARDSSRRPTAEQLLDHKFFKTVALDKHYLAKTILAGLPIITERLKMKEDGTFPMHSSAEAEEPAVDRSGSGRGRPRRKSVADVQYEVGRDVDLDAAETVKLFERLHSGEHASTSCPLTSEDVLNAEGFAYAVLRRSGVFSGNAEGNCYVVAKLPSGGGGGDGSDPGSTLWSAPAYFHLNLTASGFTMGNDEVHTMFMLSMEEVEALVTRGEAVLKPDAGQRHRSLKHGWSTTSNLPCQLSANAGACLKPCSSANKAAYGPGSKAASILRGKVRPPLKFCGVYEELRAAATAPPPCEPACASDLHSHAAKQKKFDPFIRRVGTRVGLKSHSSASTFHSHTPLPPSSASEANLLAHYDGNDPSNPSRHRRAGSHGALGGLEAHQAGATDSSGDLDPIAGSAAAARQSFGDLPLMSGAATIGMGAPPLRSKLLAMAQQAGGLPRSPASPAGSTEAGQHRPHQSAAERTTGSKMQRMGLSVSKPRHGPSGSGGSSSNLLEAMPVADAAVQAATGALAKLLGRHGSGADVRTADKAQGHHQQPKAGSHGTLNLAAGTPDSHDQTPTAAHDQAQRLLQPAGGSFVSSVISSDGSHPEPVMFALEGESPQKSQPGDPAAHPEDDLWTFEADGTFNWSA